jgi:hypothetical protein
LFIVCWIVSLVLPVFMVVEPHLLERGVMREEFLAPMGWPVLALATAGLVGLAAHGWRMTRHNRVYAMCVALGLWMVLLNGILNHGHNRAARRVPSFGAEAAALFELTRGMPVYYLADEARRTRQPGLGFRIHARRIIRPATKARLRELTEGAAAFAVLSAADSGTDTLKGAPGIEPKLIVREKSTTWNVYFSKGVGSH